MERAIESLDHFPSIAEVEKLITGGGGSGWKYFDVPDCMACGGVGWHYAVRLDGGEGVVACDECRAGKNMQQAPKPHISWTLKQAPGAKWSRPGRGR